MEIRKRFPADTTMLESTFLNDKKVNSELYAFLQSISETKDINGEKTTIVYKDKFPKQKEICDIIGLASPKTYRVHLKYLVDQGYVIEDQKFYILPNKENIYFLIPLKTLQYLKNNCKSHIFKIYIYLGQKFKYALSQNRLYIFTYKEIIEHLGYKMQNHSQYYTMVKNALELLVNSGLISYVNFYEDNIPKKRLTNFSFEYKTEEYWQKKQG